VYCGLHIRASLLTVVSKILFVVIVRSSFS
jgi:hypothetical protein